MKKERDRRYYLRHRAKILAQRKFQRTVNREEENRRSREQHHKHRERRNAYARARYQAKKQEYITRTARWIAFNRELHNTYTRKTWAKAVTELRPWYVAIKAKRAGVAPSKHKTTIQIWRTKPLFKTLLTATSLSK